MRRASREQTGAEIAARLGRRRGEIEQAILTRVYAVSQAPARGGPEYAAGLRAAVSSAVDYALAGIEYGEQKAPPLPDVLRSQARLAARSGVSLDTVLRRYLAGHALLESFLIEEVEAGELVSPGCLKRVLRSQVTLADRVLAAVSEAYSQEAESRRGGIDRRAEQVNRLLAGEMLEASELGYELKGHHLGLVAKGPRAEGAVEALASSLGRRCLSLEREDGSVWAWLGGRERIDAEDLAVLVQGSHRPGLVFAVGEPNQGLGGGRLTHEQARAAFTIARRRAKGPVRYGEVALLASLLQDDLALVSLRRLYLEPLEGERDGGETFRRTLAAYFDADRNLSSAAAALGVSRRTVANRLRVVEERIGRTLDDVTSCAISNALHIEEILGA